MESIKVSIDAVKFDRAVHGGLDHVVLKDSGDLAIYIKPGATQNGKAGAVLTFTVELPNGLPARVQTVVTTNLLEMVGQAIKGWREGNHI